MFPFPKKSKEKIRKMDILITSVVLGTIIAGAFGLKKKMHEVPEKKRSFIGKFFDIFVGR